MAAAPASFLGRGSKFGASEFGFHFSSLDSSSVKLLDCSLELACRRPNFSSPYYTITSFDEFFNNSNFPVNTVPFFPLDDDCVCKLRVGDLFALFLSMPFT